MAVQRRSLKRQTGQVGLAKAVFESLRDEITSGKLRPGEPLSRRQIAERFGCSYTTVVEAMIQLAAAGLIESESAQMARVRRVTMETIRNVYVMLEAIETQTMRLACESATDSEIAELFALAEMLDARIAQRAPKDADGPLLHWQFHKRIAQLSRYPILVRELEKSELLARFQTTWLVTMMITDPPRWHSQLVDAIQSRDPLQADAAMRAHIRRGLEKELLAYQMKMAE